MLIWVSVSGQYYCLSIIYPTMLELGVSLFLCLSLSIFLSVILSINAFVTLCSDSFGSQSNGLTPLHGIGRPLKQGNMTALNLTSEGSYPKAQKSSQSLEITLWKKQHWITEGKKGYSRTPPEREPTARIFCTGSNARAVG